jgi:Transposase DDE domain group 1
LKKDEGYAGIIEARQEELLSSHQVKRFFKAFVLLVSGKIFRGILRRLFVWRLKTEQPKVIELTIDSMVMNNDDAEQRQGVSPTYKKVKGFQPLHVIWDGRIVDAVFRGGKKNGNSGNTVVNTLRAITSIIRKEYSETVPIIVRLDAGFFDQKIFKVCDELGIGFICTGKMYDDVKTAVQQIPEEDWNLYENSRQTWRYAEWEYSAESWKEQSYRALYTRPVYEENGQAIIEFARPDNVIVTNLGRNEAVLELCSASQRRRIEDAASIIESHHDRGADELPHRGLKDFGTEKLPFKRFAPNAAYYYCMVIAFFLFECFKRDVVKEVLPQLAPAYATSVRRNIIDVAAKIIRKARQMIVKVARDAWEHLQFRQLWERALTPPLVPL